MDAKRWVAIGAAVGIVGWAGSARAQSCGGGSSASGGGGGGSGGAVSTSAGGSGTTIFDVLGHVAEAVVNGMAHAASAPAPESPHVPPPPRPALPPLSSHFFDGVPDQPAPCPCEDEALPTAPMLGSFPIEFAATTGLDSLDAGTLRWGGWSQHTALDHQVSGDSSAPGSRLGLGRVMLVGAALRVDTIVAGWLVLGLEGAYARQAGENTGSDAVSGFRAGSIQSARGGVYAGPRLQAGPMTFRAGVFVGYDYTWARFIGDAVPACDTPPELRAGRFVVRPRVQLDVEMGSYLSVGLYADADALHLGDAGGGIALSLHSDRFSGRTPPEMPAPPR